MQRPPPSAPSRTLAIIALVAGICGLIPLVGLFFSLAALVLGLIALLSGKPGTGLAVGGLLTGCVAAALNVLFLVAVIVPAVKGAQREMLKASHAAQQRQAERVASLPPTAAAPRQSPSAIPRREHGTGGATGYERPAPAATPRPARVEPETGPASAPAPGAPRDAAAALPSRARPSDNPASSRREPASRPTASRPPASTRLRDSLPVLPASEAQALVADLESGEQRRVVPASMKLIRTRPAAPQPAVAAALAGVLRDNPSLPLRVNAAHALEQWGTAESLPALRQAAGDPSPLIRTRVEKAIVRIAAETQVP